MTTTADQPTATRRIAFAREDRDYACYVTIDGTEQYIGSAPSYQAGEQLVNEYLYDYYADNHTPEAATQIAVAAFESEPREIIYRKHDRSIVVQPDGEAHAALTAADLAAGLRDALTYGVFATERKDQLESLLKRWEIQQDPPSAGRALQRQLAGDYLGTIRLLLRLHADDQSLMASAYLAYCAQIGVPRNWSADELIGRWRESAAQVEADGAN